MVFKNGELLRTYYYWYDFTGKGESSHNILFTEFADKRGGAYGPDGAGAAADSAVLGGGEIYELTELDITFSATQGRDLDFYKINMFEWVHHLINVDNTNAASIHYDRNDLRTSVDRTVPTEVRATDTVRPENWRLVLAAVQGNLTGDVRITMVVRVH